MPTAWSKCCCNRDAGQSTLARSSSQCNPESSRQGAKLIPANWRSLIAERHRHNRRANHQWRTKKGTRSKWPECRCIKDTLMHSLRAYPIHSTGHSSSLQSFTEFLHSFSDGVSGSSLFLSFFLDLVIPSKKETGVPVPSPEIQCKYFL